MCSIFGAVGYGIDRDLVEAIRQRAGDRGRDGGRVEWYNFCREPRDGWAFGAIREAVLGNWRATPTTETERAPLQPYDGFVHNGTIANDKKLLDGLGLLEWETAQERPWVDSMILPKVVPRDTFANFVEGIQRLNGSYAIAAVSEQSRSIFVACNYKPLHYYAHEDAVYFSSMRRHLRAVFNREPEQLEPYTALDLMNPRDTWTSLINPPSRRAVVIASAGLDSTTVATVLGNQGYDVTLLHFNYGCRATAREIDRIPRIARALGCTYEAMPVPYIHMRGDSPLFEGGPAIAEAVAGAEYAHEWVPARNLVFIALAVAYAEANGYGVVALGNNLEEAGAYPDNEEHFTETLNRMILPYATQNGRAVHLVTPVGHLMKHEIVKLGLALGAPYEHTWSCYDCYDMHCGNCGPCYMRRTAFERNGATDPVPYRSIISRFNDAMAEIEGPDSIAALAQRIQRT